MVLTRGGHWLTAGSHVDADEYTKMLIRQELDARMEDVDARIEDVDRERKGGAEGTGPPADQSEKEVLPFRYKRPKSRTSFSSIRYKQPFYKFLFFLINLIFYDY